MNLLARREYSRLELSTQLLKRFGKREATDMMPEGAASADELLANEGLQSAARLAEAFIRARTNKGWGLVKIRAELKQMGMATAVIDIAFNNAEVNWRELATGVTLKNLAKSLATRAQSSCKTRQEWSASYNNVVLSLGTYNWRHVNHLILVSVKE